MKKTFAGLLVCLFLAVLLSGCGRSYDSADYAPADKYENGEVWTDEAADDVETEADYSAENSLGSVSMTSASRAEKMIYTGYAEIETTQFDASVEAVYALLDKYDAYLEGSDISGIGYAADYYGYQTYRTASFTVRVPAESFSEMKTSLDGIGHVTNLRDEAENVTTQYYDTQTRLSSYQAEAQRLREMLAEAETVTDMIEIEARLSEVTYYIDSLTTTLNTLQNQVDYSTLYIELMEVAKITVQTPVTATYWEQMGEGIVQSLQNVGEFFSDLLMWIVVHLPQLVVILAIPGCVLIVVLTTVKRRKKRAQKAASAAVKPADSEKKPD